MSTWPLASWAGLRRTCTVIQLSRGRSHWQICMRFTVGGRSHGVPVATCAKKRPRSPRARASILKKGLVTPRNRSGLRPVGGDLKGETVPDEFTEFHQLTSAGRAVRFYLDLRPLAGH